MKSYFILFIALIHIQYCFSQNQGLIDNQRSDTIDVLDYKLSLDMTELSNQWLEGIARVKFEVLMNNINSISLDLLELNVDSVKQGNDLITFSYNDTLLVAQFSNPLNENDVDSITVFYSGSPITDNSGLGGFYFIGNTAFNFGVGFEANPHNYGRVWHPCFDNFVERATYDITIISSPSQTGYSIGLIESESVDGNGNNIMRWIMNDPIPSYLSGFAVSTFTYVSDTFTSPITGNDIPIMLIGQPQDTNNIKNSFVNLKNCIEIYENAYGPYIWEKVGYIFVPFNSAAMEHATAVVYPNLAANGSLQYETLMAHELVHSWFGNMLNCNTAEDMWINEGFSTYSEAVFLENKYNPTQAINHLKNKHKGVLQTAHYDDGDYHALSGIPHYITYGEHSYNKGAVVIHNLRTFLGDIDFFSGLETLLSNNQFSAMDANTFKNELANYSSTNLDDFFDGWIYNKGFPGFNIDSLTILTVSGNFNVEVHVKQRLHQAPNFFNEVPMEVTFVDGNMNEYSQTFTVNGQFTSETFSVPFEPEMAYLNGNHGTFNAVTGETKTINSTGMNIFDYAYSRVQVNNMSDSAYFRVEHHRTAPEPFENPAWAYQYELSTERFWRFDGIWPSGFDAEAQLFYDARNNASGNLDSALMVDHGNVLFHEDSIRVFWRPGAGHEWQVYDNIELNTLGSPVDGYGRVIINQVKKGEYTFGLRKNLASNIAFDNDDTFQLYPNPSQGELNIIHTLNNEKIEVVIYNTMGKTMRKFKLNQTKNNIDLNELPSGLYLIEINTDHFKATEKLILKK